MKTTIIERIRPEHLTHSDLHNEASEAVDDGFAVECYRLDTVKADGAFAGGERGEMLYIVDLGRAGIAWGADADWTDADSAADALRRYDSRGTDNDDWCN